MKRRSVKLLVLTAALTLALCLVTGCNSGSTNETPVADTASVAPATSDESADQPTPSGDKIVLGRVSFDLSQPYQQADAKAFEEIAKAQGVEVITIDGKADAETMINAVDDLISKGVSGIVIQPMAGSCADVVAESAQNAEIPLLTFVNPAITLPNPNIRLYESESSFAMGQLAATKWKEWYPDQPIKIGVIDFPAITQVHEERALSFIAGVKAVAPTAEEVVLLDGGGIRDQSMAAGEDMLQSHPEINIIYGINADSALGALAAYEAGGRGKAKDGVPLTELFVSTDATEPESLKIYDPESALKITMGLAPKGFAQVHYDNIMKMINGEIDPKSDFSMNVEDVGMNYWETPVEEYQKFLLEQYGITIDIMQQIGK